MGRQGLFFLFFKLAANVHISDPTSFILFL
jgi:hypothetical protein